MHREEAIVGELFDDEDVSEIDGSNEERFIAKSAKTPRTKVSPSMEERNQMWPRVIVGAPETRGEAHPPSLLLLRVIAFHPSLSISSLLFSSHRLTHLLSIISMNSSLLAIQVTPLLPHLVSSVGVVLIICVRPSTGQSGTISRLCVATHSQHPGLPCLMR
jgi:hypothetical protein